MTVKGWIELYLKSTKKFEPVNIMHIITYEDHRVWFIGGGANSEWACWNVLETAEEIRNKIIEATK